MKNLARAVGIGAVLGLFLAAAPVRADWLLVYEKVTGKILVVEMLPTDEAQAVLRQPGPRPGTARLHWRAPDLPVPAMCRVTPQGEVVCQTHVAPVLTTAAPLPPTTSSALSVAVRAAIAPAPANDLPLLRPPETGKRSLGESLEMLRRSRNREVGFSAAPAPAYTVEMELPR